jgi:ABC-type antimicrobial peptide transport system permease subunit
VYGSIWQGTSSGLTLLVRPKRRAEEVEPELVSLVQRIDPHMPVFSIRTLVLQMQKGINSERILAFLSSSFAMVVAALAAMGIFGVISYSVGQRTREIGIRMAIGAQRPQVLAPFLRQAVALLVLGFALGVPSAIASATLLRSILFRLQPGDPLTLLISVLAFVAVALFAVIVPLLKAARVDPATVLRHE